MKPRRVHIGLEVETDAGIKELRCALQSGCIPLSAQIHQIQINVIQGVRRKRPRQKKRSRV